jgi:TolB-like protein/Tfp pilus assembly protein PilF
MPNRLSRFWKELKRRKVIKVLAWYTGVAVVLIGLASDVAGPLNLPDWAHRIILILLIVGFPLTLIISWIFDITPEGLQKTPALDLDPAEKKDNSQFAHDPSYDGSIAVLPLQDMSPDKDQEYFCDGISEEIINALTRVERLKVIARTSAFAFKGTQMDIRDVGNSLNVANVLEGSVRKDGNKLRITIQLIRVDDGSHMWSDTYNRELKDIFSIQDEISLAIVEKLKMNLRGSAKGGILKRYTENTEAYQYYLKGLYFYSMMTPEGNQKAQENYRKALETDPNYALVYSILGSNFIFAGLQGFIPPEVSIKYAREYTEKALEIDKTVPVAHSTMGGISQLYDWDLEAAEKGFYKSVQLNPNTAWDRFFYAYFLRTVGKFKEAIAESLIALEKDPLNFYINTEIGRTFLMAGRIDQAVEKQMGAIKIFPNGFLAHMNLGEAMEVKDLLDDAIESYNKAVSLSGGSPLAEAKLASALYRAGKKAESQEKIERIEKMMAAVYIPPSILVPYYLLNKDLDRAYHWFKKSCDQKDFNLPDFINAPIDYYRIPDDPRFTALLEKTGLIHYKR